MSEIKIDPSLAGPIDAKGTKTPETPAPAQAQQSVPANRPPIVGERSLKTAVTIEATKMRVRTFSLYFGQNLSSTATLELFDDSGRRVRDMSKNLQDADTRAALDKLGVDIETVISGLISAYFPEYDSQPVEAGQVVAEEVSRAEDTSKKV